MWPLYFNEKGEVEENTISPDCPANKFFTTEYIDELRNDLHNVPENLRKIFYDETIKLGYRLDPFNKNEKS